MHRTRYLLSVIVSLFIITVTCGCVNSMETKAEKTKREALEYLNVNYLDTFTAMVYTSSNWAYNYETITFTSQKYPDEVVEVEAYENKDGTHRFIDNYYHCYMLDDAIKYCEHLVTDKNVNVKARFPYSVWSDDLDGIQSFEEWKDKGTAQADFFIITDNSLGTDAQEEIVNKIVTDKVYATIVFYVTDDEKLLKDIELDDILNNQSDYIVDSDLYYINSDFEIEKE